MIVYICIIILALFFACCAEKNRESKKNFYFFWGISFIILFLFSGLRYKVGFDYEYTYLPEYYRITNSYESRFEPLFVIVNKIAYHIFNSPDWVFLISSFITMILIYKAIRKDSDNVTISILMLFVTRFYLYSFTQVRQYIAIAIFIYAIRYIKEHNFKKYMIAILIAIGFHKTAFIYLPMYFIGKLKLSRNQYIAIILASVLLNPIVQKIYQIVGMYLYSGYIEKDYGESNSSIVMIATVLVITIIYVIFYNKIKDNEKNRIWLNIHLILCILTLTIGNVNESYRIVGMFMYVSVLLMSSCYKIATKNQKIILIIILSGMACIASYLMLSYGSGTMLPYKTIFNKG